jgi:cell division protein FtsL
MRFIHFLVICALVFAAGYVYRIKMVSTVRTERVMELRNDVREQREAIAALKAEWAKLEAPGRLQGLAARHTELKPIQTTQFDDFKSLPERPPRIVSPNDPDPIASVIQKVDAGGDLATGTIPTPRVAR